MSEWKELKIEDFCEVIGGGTPSTKEYSYYGGEISWITPRDLTNYKKRFILRGERNITELGLKNSSARILPKNSILLTSRAPIGYLAIAEKEVCTNQGFKSLVINPEKADYNFVYYLIKSNVERIKGLGTGTTFAEISGSVVKNLKFSLPDLQTQTNIAKILSSLDDKIELNNKINHELETLAQTLFKQWFIDYEFPNENGEPYKSSGGEMVESELGEIPKGWEVKRLDEISSEITRGYTTKYVEKSNIINLNQKVNRGLHLDKSNFKYYPNDTVVPENKFVRQKDILINSLGQGTLGRIHFYKENSTNVVIDQHITILRGNNEQFLPEILYLMLTFNSNQKRLEEMVTGSTGMLMLNINKIREFKVVVPPIEHQKLLNNNIVPSFENINCNILENEQLISLRDTLLPKLITGELKVNEINN
jgi:type I restriction enzyme S subunit